MWLTGCSEVSTAGQGPGELVRPVPRARQAVEPCPLHAPCSAEQHRAHAPLAAATGIPGQAQQGLCTGRTPAKAAHEALATPRHDAPGDQPVAVLACRTQHGSVLLRVHRGQTAAPLCPQASSQHSEPQEQMAWLEGREAVPRTPMASSWCPGTMPACLTSIPTRHGPSAGRLCPAAVQGGDRQDVNLPCPCLCCTKLQHPQNQLQHPQMGSSRQWGAQLQPFNSIQDAMQPHRADSSSWVASPVIDVLSTAQQLSWFRVNCA